MRSFHGVLLILSLTGAFGGSCAPSSPEAVKAAAARAAQDPKAAEGLVRALGSSKPEVREAASDALVDIGPDAAPALKGAISERRPEAGAALVVLGQMGHTGSLELMSSLLNDPALGASAREALAAADDAIYERLRRSPTMAACDEYLKSFPQGRHLDAVKREKVEQEAWAALVALGAGATVDELKGVPQRYPDTRAAEKAKYRIADQLLEQANAAIVAGRPSDAIGLMADARAWQTDLDTSAWEARAYKAMGKALAQRSDWDKAIESLEAAQRASQTQINTRELADAYLARAEERFKRGDPVGGMKDLHSAETTDPETLPFVEESRDYWVSVHFRHLEGGTHLRGVAAAALVLAADLYPASGPVTGDQTLTRVELAIKAQQSKGDPTALMEACRAGLVASPATQARMARILGAALQPVERSATALLQDTVKLKGLLSPADLWASGELGRRRESVQVLTAYENAVLLAQEYTRAGLPVGGRLSGSVPLGEKDLKNLVRQGVTPQQLPDPLQQAQYARHLLSAPDNTLLLARTDPARLALGVLNLITPPSDCAGWSLVMAEASALPVGGAKGVLLADGKRADVSAERIGATLRLSVKGNDLAAGLSPSTVSQALTVILGVGPVMLLADSSLDRVELVAGGPGTSVLAQRGRFAVRRDDLRTMNWTAIRQAAPYDPSEVSLLAEVELR